MITCNGRLPALALGLALTLRASFASAQSGDQAAARALFAEARKLMKAGKYDAACPKLEAAAKLYSGSGVLLNLADCYEHTGRTASAWNEFGATAEVAARTGRSDDEAEGRRRQQALEPRLSRLVVHVAQDVPGLTVARGGTVLDRGAWDIPIPVDPGTYALTAKATGRAPWSSEVKVTAVGATVTVEVPPLPREHDEAPEATATGPASAAPAVERAHPAHVDAATTGGTGGSGARVLGVGLTSLGAVALGTGGVLGLWAKGRFDRAEGETGTAQRTDSAGATSAGNVATAVVIAGAVTAAAGLVVWIAVPGHRATVGTDAREVFLRGTF
jgi:hypothetical protein